MDHGRWKSTSSALKYVDEARKKDRVAAILDTSAPVRRSASSASSVASAAATATAVSEDGDVARASAPASEVRGAACPRSAREDEANDWIFVLPGDAVEGAGSRGGQAVHGAGRGRAATSPPSRLHRGLGRAQPRDTVPTRLGPPKTSINDRYQTHTYAYTYSKEWRVAEHFEQKHLF